MTKYMYILGGIFFAFFMLLVARPKTNIAYTESDMEKTYPNSLGDYHMRASQPGSNASPNQSYRMDENSYRALVPYGIVARVLDNGHHAYDTVIIAGDQPDTFHNPLVCFASQDYKIGKNEKITLHTQSRGDVPFMLATATKKGATQIALYTYEGPSKMVPENSDLHKDMFLTQLKTGRPQSATFFRFLTLDPTATEQDLENFAVQYLDSCPVRPQFHQS